MLDFESAGQDRMECLFEHARLGEPLTYVVARYARPGFSAWFGRVLRGDDIIADSEFMPSADDAVAWAERTARAIEAGDISAL